MEKPVNSSTPKLLHSLPLMEPMHRALCALSESDPRIQGHNEAAVLYATQCGGFPQQWLHRTNAISFTLPPQPDILVQVPFPTQDPPVQSRCPSAAQPRADIQDLTHVS